VKRLASLNPRWIGRLRPNSGEGIEFDCPVCPTSVGHRLVAYFENAIDGGPPPPWKETRWSRIGEDFDRLTLEPSINYPGHWHGWVEDGQVVDVAESPAEATLEDGRVVSLSPRQYRGLIEAIEKAKAEGRC
jgi:hypothetical protein